MKEELASTCILALNFMSLFEIYIIIAELLGAYKLINFLLNQIFHFKSEKIFGFQQKRILFCGKSNHLDF